MIISLYFKIGLFTYGFFKIKNKEKDIMFDSFIDLFLCMLIWPIIWIMVLYFYCEEKINAP